MKVASVVALLALAVTLPVNLSGQTPVTVGTGALIDCYPFGCGGLSRYQQVYDASSFSGPMSIGTIGVYHLYHPIGDRLNAGTYYVYMSTTSMAVGALSTNLDANVTSSESLFATVVIGGTQNALPNAWYYITATTPFQYDPGDGNLLLDVRIPGAYGAGNGDAYFAGNTMTGVTEAAFEGDALYPGTATGVGVVTQFTTPEPSSVALLGTGLVGVLPVFRRRRARE